MTTKASRGMSEHYEDTRLRHIRDVLRREFYE